MPEIEIEMLAYNAWERKFHYRSIIERFSRKAGTQNVNKGKKNTVKPIRYKIEDDVNRIIPWFHLNTNAIYCNWLFQFKLIAITYKSTSGRTNVQC